MKKSLMFFLLLILVAPISLTMSGCGKSIPEGAPTTEEEIDAAAVESADGEVKPPE